VAATLRGVATVDADNSNSVSVPTSAYSGGAPLAGDYLYAVVVCVDQPMGEALTGIATPSGWTRLGGSNGVGGGVYSVGIFRRTASGTSADAVTFADGGATLAEESYSVTVLDVTGGAGDTAGAYALNGSSSSTETLASVGGTGDLLIELWALGSTASLSALTKTLPGTATAAGDTHDTSGYARTITATEALGTAGTRTLTMSANVPTFAGMAIAVHSGITVTAAGSLTLTGTAAGAGVASGIAGSLSLAGAATAAAPISLNGSLTLTGSVLAAAPVTASGALTLTGTASARAAAGPIAGSLTLTATSAATAAVGATGGLTLAGTGNAGAPQPATAAGSLVLTGTATAYPTGTGLTDSWSARSGPPTWHGAAGAPTWAAAGGTATWYGAGGAPSWSGRAGSPTWP